MRISTGVAWMTLVAATVLVASPVRAERVDSVSWAQYQQRVDELESELKALKSRLNDGRGPAPTMHNASYVHGNSSTEVAGTTHGFHGESTSSVYSHDGGSCDSCCYDTCCRPCGFYAGAGVVFVKPHFQENIGFSRLVASGGIATSVQNSFDYDYDPSSRVWLGYVNEDGVGVRGTWWQYDHAAPQLVDFDPGFGTNLALIGTTGSLVDQVSLLTTDLDAGVARHELQFDVYDLEATKRIFAGMTEMTFSGGARYVSMRQRLRLDTIALNQTITGILFNDLAFDGVGPTFGMEMRRPVWHTGISLVGGARGSVLFGSRTQDYGAVTSTAAIGTFRREEQVMGIFEVMIGAEYAYITGNGSRLFARGTAEAQLWTGAGSATNGITDMGLIGFGGYFGIAR